MQRRVRLNKARVYNYEQLLRSNHLLFKAGWSSYQNNMNIVSQSEYNKGATICNYPVGFAVYLNQRFAVDGDG